MRISFALRAGSALAALAIASTANAQDNVPPPDAQEAPASTSTEPSDVGDIVVTGSRIRRDPLSQDAPVTFVDQQDIAKTGLNSINDVLQRLPSSGGGLNSKFNNSGNLGNPPDGGGVGAGSAEIDLRYLGSRRTLVLVDSLRFVNGASASGVPGSVDLNAIPESMIERVEVLQDGASAIYGSDAIAGVVNIITKQSQNGFVASAQLGSYLEEGDGFTQNYQLSWGNGGDAPLQIVVGGNYVKSAAVSSGDRAISRWPAPYGSSCADGGCSGFLPNGRYIGSIFGGSGDTTLIAPVLNGTTTPADFRDFVSPDDRFNFAPYNYLQIPLERYGVFGNLHAEVTENVNFSFKLLWNQRKSKNKAAPLPFGIGQAAGITPVLDSLYVDATNPYNPFGVDIDSSNMDLIYRRFVEGGPRRFSQQVDTYYGVVTFDGKFDIGGRDWYWDVNGVYGQNNAKQRMLGNVNSQKLGIAIGPLATCNATPGCVPFNFFGGAGSISQAMMDYVTFIQNDKSEQSIWDFTGNISGELFDLPGGPLGVAAGLEYRKLSGSFDPDPVVAAGFSSDIPAQPTRGHYDVKEAYLELNAPILSGVTGIELLEVNGAVRFSDYSTSGSTTTFKGQVNWKPFKDLRFRGSYAEGFRAPTIGELFGTQSRFDQTISDPCSNDSTAPQNFLNDATVRANCIAAGVPAGGTYQQANPQISVIVGGNQGLVPETSKSWVFGGVYSPSFLPRTSLEVNHYNIKIDGAIQTVAVDVTLSNCVVNNDPAACALVTRAGSGGQLTQISGFLVNIAGVKTKGWDINFRTQTPETSAGRFGFTWNNTILKNFDVIVPITGGTQTISREGTEQGSP
ncbi:TonB-dependent receptor plug domain-containing protein, partial [Sphingomonas daechungensis]|uniref:TonB-dependent receptor plug domain-containing protein n=1 Tax=Sphingomonas daechungensis TaxID=1176646 RepID=UPI003783FFBA